MKQVLSISIILSIFGVCLPMGNISALGQTSSPMLESNQDTLSDSARIDFLIDLSTEMAPKSVNESLKYAQEALELAQAGTDSMLIGRAYLALGQAHTICCNVEQGLVCCQKALGIAEALGDPCFHSNALNTMGTIEHRVQRYKQAKAHYLEALEFAEQANDNLMRGRNLNSLGVNAWYQEEYAQAEKYYEKCLEVYKVIGDPLGMASALNNLAMIQQIREEYDQARSNYEESIQIKKENGFTNGIAATLGNLGELHLICKRYEEARESLEESRDIAAKHNAPDIQLNAYKSLADLYAQTGEFRLAFENQKLAFQLESKMFSEKNLLKILELERKNEAEKAKLEIVRLTLLQSDGAKEIVHQRRMRLILTLGFICAMLGVMALIWLYRQKNRAHQKVSAQAEELELAASKISTLTELIPICATCKMIRDPEGNWHQLESFLNTEADLNFTHGICPGCKTEVLLQLDRK